MPDSDIFLRMEPAESASPPRPRSARLVSLDVFRGATVAAMIFVNNPGDWGHVLPPFGHAEWHGCTPTDLIFPFFLFIVGVAAVLSLDRRGSQGASRAELSRHAVRRGLTIVVIGWLLAAYPFTWHRIAHLRIPGVLPRIGLVFAIGAPLLIASGKRRALGAALAAAALMGVHAFLLLGTGFDLTKEGNVQTAVDLALLKGHLWKPAWDPEGIVSTLSAVATMLTGSLAAILLSSARPLKTRLVALAAGGLAGVGAGLAIEAAGLPVNKGLWTPSYVFFTSGWACLSIAAAVVLVDVWGLRKPLAPFVTFGTNPLLGFVLSGFLAKNLSLVAWTSSSGKKVSLHAFLYEKGFGWLPSPFAASHAYALAMVAVCWAILRYCERRGWFWKV